VPYTVRPSVTTLTGSASPMPPVRSTVSTLSSEVPVYSGGWLTRSQGTLSRRRAEPFVTS
jgi:hypothetical protein